MLSRFFHREYPDPDEVRMTLGEHLEELRSRLIRCIIAILLGTVFCFVFRNQVLGILSWQVFAVLRRQGQEPSLNYFSITETFVLDLKLAMLLGAILTAPYSLTQIWGFVAAGLYRHERKWVNRFAPASIILFFTGGIFFIMVVYPAMLSFLISYRGGIDDYGRHVPGWLMPGSSAVPLIPAPATQPVPTTQPDIPGFANDPQSFPEGKLWLNTADHQLKIRYDTKTYAVAHLREETGEAVVSATLRLTDYIMLELQMAAAFGVGFQVPVVIAFLAVVGIFNVAQMASARRYVYFGMSVVAAIFTPSPDVVSMLLLLTPMMVLFEGGLIVARMIQRERETASST